MTRFEKALTRILSGTADANLPFADLCLVLQRFGFRRRIKGSHHIFAREGVDEILNVQPGKDGKSKPYQVKQVREVILKYELGGSGEEE